jgi:hypothetical protein
MLNIIASLEWVTLLKLWRRVAFIYEMQIIFKLDVLFVKGVEYLQIIFDLNG